MCLSADPGVSSSIPTRSHTFMDIDHEIIPTQSHTFMDIDHEIISTVILLPSAESRRVHVSYKKKYVHKVLINRFVKLAQEKSVVRWTDRPNMTIAVDWDIKHQTKQTNQYK